MAEAQPFAGRRWVRFGCAMIVLAVAIASQPACRVAQPVTARAPAELEAEEIRLAGALRELGEKVDPLESRRVARVIVRTVEDARISGGIDGRPIQRNLAVAVGWHDWGLCWQWAELLGRRLHREGLKSLALDWGCAHAGSHLREHNALVITAKGQPFEEGLVVDPWRRGGRLVWIRVADDRYPWKHEPWSEIRWESPVAGGLPDRGTP